MAEDTYPTADEQLAEHEAYLRELCRQADTPGGHGQAALVDGLLETIGRLIGWSSGKGGTAAEAGIKYVLADLRKKLGADPEEPDEEPSNPEPPGSVQDLNTPGWSPRK